MIAHMDRVVSGCCGLQRSGVASYGSSFEVKRLFVVPQARGSGAADALMNAVEELTAKLAGDVLCLETGIRQPEAIRFALRRGFAPVDPFPPYIDDPFARCFAKSLGKYRAVPTNS